MNFKKAWKEFWGSKHRHSYTHSAEAVRHNKIVNCDYKDVEEYWDMVMNKPHIEYNNLTGHWICQSEDGPWDLCIGAGESVLEAYESWRSKVVGKKPTLEDKQRHFEKTKMENFKHSSRLEGIVYD